MTDANALSAGLRFEHLTTFSPDELSQIQSIYDVSFPRKERKPFWMITEAMGRGHYSVFTVSQDRGTEREIVAFSFMVKLRRSQAMYIEYLAVQEALRGQGIGSFLMRSIIEFLKNAAVPAIVWEVDPPEKPGDDHARRIVFYERLGASLIEQSKRYAMPNYFKGSGTLPLRLMWQPLQTDRSQPTKSELIDLIMDIYEIEYPGQAALALRDEIIANLDKP